MEVVSDYLAGLGLDIIKNSVEEKIDEVKLKSKLKSFIENQKKYNELCSLAEEYDFQGLIEYISDNLLEVAKIRLRSTNSKERGQARQEIIDAAVSYSGANTEEAKKRVGRLIGCCLDIVRDFFKGKNSLQYCYLAADMVDSIKENTDEGFEKSTEEVIQAVTNEGNKTRQSVEMVSREVSELKKSLPIGALFSIDRACDLMQSGQQSVIEKDLNKLFDHMSIEHPLYPEYGYGFENNKLKSIPRSSDATKLHPPRFRFTGQICAGDYYFNDPDVDPFNYAYRHQVTLVLSVKEAIKLLGDVPDPIQGDAEELLGKKVMLKPPAFPPAFPCSIKIGNQVFYDYILLRTQEILDDGTYIISNKEQAKAEIYFEIRWKLMSVIHDAKENYVEVESNDGIAKELNSKIDNEIEPARLKPVDFKIQIRNKNHRGMLNYKKIMLELSKHGDLHIFSLELHKDVFAGIVSNFEAETGFTSLEEEVDFLERICTIEDYYNVNFDLPDEITAQEYQCIIQTSKLIMEEQVDFTWEETEGTGIVSEHFRKVLEKMETPISMLAYVGTTDVNIFGAKFSYDFMRTYKEAVMQDIDRIRRLVEQLEDGDPLKIKFKSGEDKTGFDTLKIPEEFLETVEQTGE